MISKLNISYPQKEVITCESSEALAELLKREGVGDLQHCAMVLWSIKNYTRKLFSICMRKFA
jgi:hypothetical protein